MAGWNYAKAEAEHRAVVAVRARVLGAEHPDTLISRERLALLLRWQDKFPEAVAEYLAVLDVRVRALGALHPDTLYARHNLAATLRRWEDFVE